LNSSNFEKTEGRTADPSTALRFGRDDKFAGTIREFVSRIEKNFGGADRDRTGDPLLAKQVLSQLSYSPLACNGGPG
jgi:hypothetical protein